MRDHAALVAYIRDRAAAPFGWGREQNNCVSFANGAIEAQTGRDLVAELGLDWTDEVSARRALHGRDGIVHGLTRSLGRPVPVSLARRGDVAMVRGGRAPLLMVVEGETLVGPNPEGLRRLPRARMRRAWSAEGGG